MKGGGIYLKISDNAHLTVIYISDLEGTKETVVFDGSIKDFDNEHQSFKDLDDSNRILMRIGENQDRLTEVFSVKVLMKSNGNEYKNLYYFVAPSSLNFHHIDSDNLSFESYL